MMFEVKGPMAFARLEPGTFSSLSSLCSCKDAVRLKGTPGLHFDDC